jgi:hypothetical protein
MLDDRSSIPGRRGKVLFSTASGPALVPTQPAIRSVHGGFPLKVKRPDHEADHTPQSSAEVNKGGAVPALPIHLNCVVLNCLNTRTTLCFCLRYFNGCAMKNSATDKCDETDDNKKLIPLLKERFGKHCP